ncbi:MAG: GntR family transcriptional regulator [Actinobacteria bacterium]|nr:GntR family transcriptional regulator [Actinomycetota bacterium]
MATTEEVLDKLAASCARLREEGGSRLPSERALAKDCHASRSTVRRALGVLAEQGVVTIKRGRNGGAYLSQPADAGAAVDEHLFAVWSTGHGKITRSFSKMTGIPQSLSEQGLDVGIRVLSLGLNLPRESVASDLDLGEGEPAICLARLRFAGGEPLSLERMYLSLSRFPHLLEEGLRGATSMYVLFQERYGLSVASVEEEIEITTAGPEVAQLLTIRAGSPLVKLRRRAFDRDGRLVESSRDLFRGDRTRLTVRTHDPGPHQATSRPDVGIRPWLRDAPPP